jgi:hypothetical protein
MATFTKEDAHEYVRRLWNSLIPRPGTLRPSRVLGLLLSVVIGTAIGLVLWQLSIRNDDRRLQSAQWVVVFASFTAIIGWLTNAIVTIRNSVKQHTINTLLQSRLSAAYTQKAAQVVAGLRSGIGFRSLTEDDLSKAPPDSLLDDIQFFLNHFEFIAAGIRYGDLDEDMLKGTLRGMVERYCSMAKVMIDAHRSAQGVKTYEHLVWLNRRWTVCGWHASVEMVLLVLVFVGVAANSAFYTPVALDAVTARDELRGAELPTAPNRAHGKSLSPSYASPRR